MFKHEVCLRRLQLVMKKSVNIGIIGCANIARRYMIPAILDMRSKFILQGIASRTEKKALEFANQFNIKPFIGYERLLEEQNIDAVYIPLPNSMHAEWIGKAIDRNLNVIVEKSLACNQNDVQRLNNIALDKNLILIENFQFRFHKQLGIIQQLVTKGKIGELRCVRSSFGFPPFLDVYNIRYKKELGGGALLDAGAYPIKIAQIFLGQEIEVTSANLLYDKEKDVDIWGGAYLKQKNGSLFAEIAFGFDNYYQCNLELWGSEGKISANRIFTAPPDYPAEIVLETSNGKEITFVEPDNHFLRMLQHFYSLFNDNRGLEAEYAQNINQSRLLNELKVKATEE